MACACKNTDNGIPQAIVIPPNISNNCNTTLEYLNYLNNLITLNINNTNISQEDRYLLQVYKGQVLSGINLINYCYTNYKVLETNVYNVISKYM